MSVILVTYIFKKYLHNYEYAIVFFTENGYFKK